MQNTLLTSSDLLQQRLGTVRLDEQAPVVAGSMGTWTITYTVGSYGIDEGGTIKLAHRFASDWQSPQFDKPTESGYATVRTNGAAKLAVRYDNKGHIRPWMRAMVIDLYAGSLAPGDEVVMVLGDRSGGSPGTRAQTFQESAHQFCVFVDPTNAVLARPVAEFPTVPVIAGPAVRTVCVVPTQAAVGKPVMVRVRGDDAWGNPTSAPADLTLRWVGNCKATLQDYLLTLHEPGTGYIEARFGQVVDVSNPVTAYAQAPQRGQYWADLHAQTNATVGTGTEEEYFTFGRDSAFLDLISHQGNDFQMTDEDWARLNDTTRRFHKDGSYVVLPGYEWSANTPAGGDHNVFYLDEGQPILRSSHWQVPNVPEDERTPAHPLATFFTKMRQHVPLEKVIVGSHVGGRYADLTQPLDDELAPLVELVSCWGIFEWMLFDAIDQGYIVGVMANSDGHKGRPGAEGPGAGEFGIGSGLTCVLAKTLTREGVFEALKNRRCYGTTGPRIDLQFEVAGQPMGAIVTTSKRSVHVKAHVVGAGPLEALQLFVGREMVASVQPRAFADLGKSQRVRVQWGGAKMRGRGRRVTWDGTLRVDGASITQFSPYAFDSPADGVTQHDAQTLKVSSRTTGDEDGVDLVLDGANQGKLSFTSEAGSVSVDLAQLGDEPVRKDLGGVGMHITVRRYPEAPSVRTLCLEQDVVLPENADATMPIFVKAIQADGHMAWASPVYAKRGS